MGESLKGIENTEKTQIRRPLTKSDKIAAFFLWLTIPKEQRNPQTMQEMADYLDLGIATLYRWKTEPDADKHYEVARRKYARTFIHNHLAGIMDALVISAQNPAAAHNADRKLALKLAGIDEDAPRKDEVTVTFQFGQGASQFTTSATIPPTAQIEQDDYIEVELEPAELPNLFDDDDTSNGPMSWLDDDDATTAPPDGPDDDADDADDIDPYPPFRPSD